jgi:HD-GYP domain-containing protein (c-di-GMP phosphodiesterase class II)
VVLFHHEKYDGSGYPFGLKGRRIPLPARIFAVIDAVDSMLFDRPYRKALSYSHIVRELGAEAGKHFDPEIVSMFLALYEYGWRREQRPGKPAAGLASAGQAN